MVAENVSSTGLRLTPYQRTFCQLEQSEKETTGLRSEGDSLALGGTCALGETTESGNLSPLQAVQLQQEGVGIFGLNPKEFAIIIQAFQGGDTEMPAAMQGLLDNATEELNRLGEEKEKILLYSNTKGNYIMGYHPAEDTVIQVEKPGTGAIDYISVPVNAISINYASPQGQLLSMSLLALKLAAGFQSPELNWKQLDEFKTFAPVALTDPNSPEQESFRQKLYDLLKDLYPDGSLLTFSRGGEGFDPNLIPSDDAEFEKALEMLRISTGIFVEEAAHAFQHNRPENEQNEIDVENEMEARALSIAYMNSGGVSVGDYMPEDKVLEEALVAAGHDYTDRSYTEEFFRNSPYIFSQALALDYTDQSMIVPEFGAGYRQPGLSTSSQESFPPSRFGAMLSEPGNLDMGTAIYRALLDANTQDMANGYLSSKQVQTFVEDGMGINYFLLDENKLDEFLTEESAYFVARAHIEIRTAKDLIFDEDGDLSTPDEWWINAEQAKDATRVLFREPTAEESKDWPTATRVNGTMNDWETSSEAIRRLNEQTAVINAADAFVLAATKAEISADTFGPTQDSKNVKDLIAKLKHQPGETEQNKAAYYTALALASYILKDTNARRGAATLGASLDTQGNITPDGETLFALVADYLANNDPAGRKGDDYIRWKNDLIDHFKTVRISS